jgi:D-alanyl-D-alanine carboxypeptidase/D-alanyl-D-alanine-endopeptidase (penicillin-binding protein 4)
MTFQWQVTVRNTPFLLLFLTAQLLSGVAVAPKKLLAFQSPHAVAETQQAADICPAQLENAIATVINRPQFRRSRWGIVITPLLSKDRPLYSHDAERYFIPASNAKLLTTAAALLQLGTDFQIRTSIYETGAGVLIVGRGDPSLSAAQLKDLAQQLKGQGIRSVRQLIVDDGYFQGDALNSNWEWEDVLSDYATSVNSLILNQNAVELTLFPHQLNQPLKMSWSDPIAASQWQVVNHSLTREAGLPADVAVTTAFGKPLLQITGHLAIDSEPDSFGLAVLDPAEYFLQHFQQVLAAEGIRVTQALVASSSLIDRQRELAGVNSPTLETLVLETNQQSNNLYAEVLLRTLGTRIAQDRQSTYSTAEAGLEVVKETLTQVGIDPESYILSDSSGLSRHNLVSPEAIAKTLQAMAQTPYAAVYRASLPVAGTSGTLRRRFQDTAAQGKLQGKTGTLSGVGALSGYLDVPDYQPLVFSIMVNQSDQPNATLRQAIDEIVLLLTRLRSCS